MEQQPSQNMAAGATSEKKQKKNKGLIWGMVACAVLAVAGIGFGVYGMIGMNQSSSDLSDLKVQLADTDGNITTLETDKIEVSNDTDTITITDSSTPRKNPILSAEAPDAYHLEFESTNYGENYDSIVRVTVQDGEVAYCDVYSSTTYNSTDCSITGLSGKIYKVFEIMVGQQNGGDSMAFIMEDGSVYYLPLADAVANMDFSVKGKLDIKGNVIDAVAVTLTNVGEDIGAGITTVFVLSDGTYVQYDESMLK